MSPLFLDPADLLAAWQKAAAENTDMPEKPTIKVTPSPDPRRGSPPAGPRRRSPSADLRRGSPLPPLSALKL